MNDERGADEIARLLKRSVARHEETDHEAGYRALEAGVRAAGRKRLALRASLLVAAPAIAFALWRAGDRDGGRARSVTAASRASGGAAFRAAETPPAEELLVPLACEGPEWPADTFTGAGTIPASHMREALGVVAQFSDEQPERLMNAVAAGGIRRLSWAVPWGDASFDDPGELRPDKRALLARWTSAATARGLRPSIAVFGSNFNPVPKQKVTIALAAPARAGATSLRFECEAARALPPGRSGLPAPPGGTSVEVLFTDVGADGAVELARPLPRDVPAGPTLVTVWRHAPFERPGSGPAFEDTMQGWLSYVSAVCRTVRGAAGPRPFDLELGDADAPFFDRTRFSDPAAAKGAGTAADEIRKAIVARTAALVDDASGPCAGARLLDDLSHAQGTTPLALSAPHVTARKVVLHAHELIGVDAAGQPRRARAIFPELPLVEQLGELGVASSGRPPLAITAFNLNPLKLETRFFSLPAATIWRFKAKALLRAASAFVGHGVPVFSLYRAFEPALSPIDATRADGGDAMRATSRFLRAFDGEAAPGALRIDRAAACGRAADERVAFFPFQRAEGSFVAPVYVMTTDLLAPRGADASSPRAFDLAPRAFVLELAGVRGARVELYDPLDDRVIPLAGPEARPDGMRITVPLTDAPRLLTVTAR